MGKGQSGGEKIVISDLVERTNRKEVEPMTAC